QSSANALRFGFVALITGSGLGTVAVGVGVAGLMGEVEDLVGGGGGFLFPALRRGVILPPVLGRGRMQLLRHPRLGGRPRSLVLEVVGVVFELVGLRPPWGGGFLKGGPGGGFFPQGGSRCGLPLGGLSSSGLGRRL